MCDACGKGCRHAVSGGMGCTGRGLPLSKGSEPRVEARVCRKAVRRGMERAGRCGPAATRVVERSRPWARADSATARAEWAEAWSAPGAMAPLASRKAAAHTTLMEAI